MYHLVSREDSGYADRSFLLHTPDQVRSLGDSGGGKWTGVERQGGGRGWKGQTRAVYDYRAHACLQPPPARVEGMAGCAGRRPWAPGCGHRLMCHPLVVWVVSVVSCRFGCCWTATEANRAAAPVVEMAPSTGRGTSNRGRDRERDVDPWDPGFRGEEKLLGTGVGGGESGACRGATRCVPESLVLVDAVVLCTRVFPRRGSASPTVWTRPWLSP